MASPDIERWISQAQRGSAMDHDDVRRSALRALSTLGYYLEAMGFDEDNLGEAIFNAIEDMLNSLDFNQPLNPEIQSNVLLEIQKELRNV